MVFKFLLLVVIVVAFAWARKATPAGNKCGQRIHGEANSAPSLQHLKVASFNIQTGKSNEGKRDITASARVLQNVDVAGVQEVYAPSVFNLLGMGQQQTQVLAKQGGFTWLFCATRRRWLREHRGNVLLSKLNVLDWRIEMLPDRSGKSYRNMTVAELEWQGQTFHFINTHLHTKLGRAEQLDAVLREFARYSTAILVGDLNSRASMAELAEALKNVEITDAIAMAGLDTDNSDRIDWILTKGFDVHSGRVLEKGVSDHPYYEVSLSYKT